MRKNIAAQLDTVHTEITRTLEVCSSTNKSVKLKAALAQAGEEITTTVRTLQESPRSRSFVKTRKALVAIGNTVNGLLEGLNSRDLSVKDFRAVCSNLQTKFIPNFVSNLSQEVANLPENYLSESAVASVGEESKTAATAADTLPKGDKRVRAALASGKSLQEQLAEIKSMLQAAPKMSDPEDEEEDPDESEEEKAARMEEERALEQARRENAADASSMEVIQALRKKRSLLPTRFSKTSLYSIVKLPLVPVFPENFKITESRNLDRCGIKHTMIQGYAFLEEQLILCISRTEVEKMNVSKTDTDKALNTDKVASIKGLHSAAEKRATSLADKLLAYSDELREVQKKELASRATTAAIRKELLALTSEYKKLAPASAAWSQMQRIMKLKEAEAAITDSDALRLAHYNNRALVVKRRTEFNRLAKLDPKTLTKDELRARDDFRAYEKMITALQETKAKAPETLTLEDNNFLRHHSASLQPNMKKQAESEVAGMSPAQQLKLTAIRAKIAATQKKMAPTEKLTARVRDISASMKAVQAQIADQDADIERRRVDVHNAKKLLKPKEVAVSPMDYAVSVLSHVNEVSSAAYTLVTPEFKVNIRNADILCFWVMPARKLNQLFRDAGGKTKVQWSFPWDA